MAQVLVVLDEEGKFEKAVVDGGGDLEKVLLLDRGHSEPETYADDVQEHFVEVGDIDEAIKALASGEEDEEGDEDGLDPEVEEEDEE
jgi:hypothetical protein